MLPKTVEEVKAHAGYDTFHLTDDEQSSLFDHLAPKEIIVTDKNKKHEGYCLNCRTHILLDRSIHGQKEVCPHCLKLAYVAHSWRRDILIYSKALAYLYRRSLLAPSCLVSVTALVTLIHRRDSETEIESLRCNVSAIDSISVFSPGEGGVQMIPADGHKVDYLRGDTYKISTKPPHRRDGIYGTYGSRISVLIDDQHLFQLADGTPWSYGLAEYSQYAKDAYLGYLHVMHRWPAYEMLVKMNLGQVVADKLEPVSNSRYYWKQLQNINWRGKTLDKILGFRLTKEERRYLSGTLDKAQISKVIGSLALRQAKLPSNPTILDIIKFDSAANLESIEKNYGISIKKLSQYAQKQGRLSSIDYHDYLRQLDRLGLDRTKDRLFPKSFPDAHLRLSERIKIRNAADKEKDYQQQRKKKRRLYHYHGADYYIITPPRVTMLIKEGELQHNCVAGYIDRVSTGKTNVVFLRKKSDWRTPFGTVEVREDGFIIQARAAFNKPLPADANAFIEKFSEEVKRRLAKQQKTQTKTKKKGKKTA